MVLAALTSSAGRYQGAAMDDIFYAALCREVDWDGPNKDLRRWVLENEAQAYNRKWDVYVPGQKVPIPQDSRYYRMKSEGRFDWEDKTSGPSSIPPEAPEGMSPEEWDDLSPRGLNDKEREELWRLHSRNGSPADCERVMKLIDNVLARQYPALLEDDEYTDLVEHLKGSIPKLVFGVRTILRRHAERAADLEAGHSTDETEDEY